MTTICATVYHMPFNAEMKFRCENSLVARFERIASLERRKVSDLARLVFEDYIKNQEHSMNLVLHDQPAPKNVTQLPTAAASAPPTRYRKARKK